MPLKIAAATKVSVPIFISAELVGTAGFAPMIDAHRIGDLVGLDPGRCTEGGKWHVIQSLRMIAGMRAVAPE